MNENDLLEKTTKCIRCGFCLEACPTFSITGQETESPRGRIYLVRSALKGEVDWKSTRLHLDRCLGCRACETACPSGVEYGAILEAARARLEPSRPLVRRLTRQALLSVLTNPSRLRRMLRISPVKKVPRLLSWLLGTDPPTATMPVPEPIDIPITPPPKHPQRIVYLLEGCVMSAAFQRAHRATINLLHYHDCKVITPKVSCCGALHIHNGNLQTGISQARKLVTRFDLDYPVLTHSAGCGSTMKEYAHILNDSAASGFSRRVKDITEYLYEIDYRPPSTRVNLRVAYHDACHLAHGQKIRKQPRELIASVPGVQLIEIDDDHCCGSAGIYNLTQPALARRLLDLKCKAILRASPDVVVSGNPGCLAWLRQGCDLPVLHTSEFLWRAYGNLFDTLGVS